MVGAVVVTQHPAQPLDVRRCHLWGVGLGLGLGLGFGLGLGLGLGFELNLATLLVVRQPDAQLVLVVPVFPPGSAQS